jgi:hypothetical protein
MDVHLLKMDSISEESKRLLLIVFRYKATKYNKTEIEAVNHEAYIVGRNIRFELHAKWRLWA